MSRGRSSVSYILMSLDLKRVLHRLYFRRGFTEINARFASMVVFSTGWKVLLVVGWGAGGPRSSAGSRVRGFGK